MTFGLFLLFPYYLIPLSASLRSNAFPFPLLYLPPFFSSSSIQLHTLASSFLLSVSVLATRAFLPPRFTSLRASLVALSLFSLVFILLTPPCLPSLPFRSGLHPLPHSLVSSLSPLPFIILLSVCLSVCLSLPSF